MKRDHRLNEKWIKASIAGTIWAASEIVLGSFLHNLGIPFSGNILTAIGLIILISISFLWKERGLFWRAGLICSIMKTMSPSAVIFGPMIAIIAESVLLELSVLLLGRNLVGYAAGAMLAMSWNLFQKIISFIIYYGPNIIDVYTNLVTMAGRQLRIETNIVWLPVIILLVVYALFGLFAAIIGIKAGKRILKQPASNETRDKKLVIENPYHLPEKQFDYSIYWLLFNILLIISSFLLLSYTEWHTWSSCIIIIAIIWGFRYRNSLRRLSKPKFWILFVSITIATAFVFTRISGGGIAWQEGLLAGIQMNFRAIVIILGFSVLGTELYNPVVRNFFAGTYFSNLPLAIELSVKSLPDFIASVPEFRKIIKDPVTIFSSVLSQAGLRLSEIKQKKKRVIIVSGEKGQGKTTCIKHIIQILIDKHIKVGGIISERIISENVTTGYIVQNIITGESEVFLNVAGSNEKKIGKFFIIPAGLEFGKNAINQAVAGRHEVIVIDEAGRLELDDGGWAENLNELMTHRRMHLVVAVRKEFTGNFISKWNLDDAEVIDVADGISKLIADSIEI